MKRNLGCIAAILLLVGCATGGSPGQYEAGEFAFDPSYPTGLAVVGVALNHPASDIPYLLLDAPTAAGAGFVQVDIAGDRVIRDGGFINAVRTRCAPAATHPNGCDQDFQKLVYFPVEVPPGDYMLASIFGQEKGSTVFLGDQGSYILSVQGNLESGTVPWFSIKAGEILYVGDLILDVRRRPASVVEIRMSPEGARQMLAGYPNIVGEMTVGVMHAPKIPGGAP